MEDFKIYFPLFGKSFQTCQKQLSFEPDHMLMLHLEIKDIFPLDNSPTRV